MNLCICKKCRRKPLSERCRAKRLTEYSDSLEKRISELHNLLENYQTFIKDLKADISTIQELTKNVNLHSDDEMNMVNIEYFFSKIETRYTKLEVHMKHIQALACQPTTLQCSLENSVKEVHNSLEMLRFIIQNLKNKSNEAQSNLSELEISVLDTTAKVQSLNPEINSKSELEELILTTENLKGKCESIKSKSLQKKITNLESSVNQVQITYAQYDSDKSDKSFNIWLESMTSQTKSCSEIQLPNSSSNLQLAVLKHANSHQSIVNQDEITGVCLKSVYRTYRSIVESSHRCIVASSNRHIVAS